METITAAEPKTYQVPEENLSLLQMRIAKLAKRANKLNVPAPTLTVVATREIKSTFEGITRVRLVHGVVIAGEAPKIAGWAFAAVLQPVMTEDGSCLGNLLRTVPGFEQAIPERYRNTGNNCDHCQTARRRNETFVLVSDTGDWKQVGRQCLHDFLGHMSPDTYASWAEILIDAADLAGMAEDEGFGGGGSGVARFEAEEILTLGASCIRLYGFRSNKTARENGKQSTSTVVSEWIHAREEDRKKWESPLEPNDADKQQAADVFAWMQTLNQREDLNDYFYNLSLLGQGATFTTRNFGLAISAISVWAKEQEREINRIKRFAEDANSQYVGTVGVRSTFSALTLVYTQDFESDWGVSHLYKFKSSEGNILVWFSSAVLSVGNSDIEVGDVVSLVASVKKQEERNGVKQTTITRAKIEPRKLSKEEKKAISKLKRVLKHIPYNYAARSTIDALIAQIRDGEEKLA